MNQKLINTAMSGYIRYLDWRYMEYSFEHELPVNFKVLHMEDYKKIDFDEESEKLLEVLNRASKENDIQSYIKNNEKWFIPLSILKDYDFGHHFACVVPEYPLGENYRVDYLLIGKNSIGYQFVLVEFEDVNVEFKQKNSNQETQAVRKGITQIRDWKRWLDKNKSYFEDSEGISVFGRNIPSWGFYYCLVVGRRSLMDDMANQLRGELQHEISGFKVISYDRLVENVRFMSNGI